MNDIEKAIKQFKRWEASGWSKSEVPNTYMLISAKEALEKQLPKAKYNQGTQCGNCYATIQDTDNYCFNCGQRILQED